jgi:hypothetical protein
MHVRLLGFNFKAEGTGLTLQTFVDYVQSQRGRSHDLGPHKRLLFVNSTHSAKYYAGLLVTVKDQKTYCELVESSGKLTVKVNELDADSNLMDFNFFVLNKLNGLGLYQYYHQSCSLNSFGYYCASRFGEYRKVAVDSALAAIPEDELTNAKANSIRQKHSARLKWEILVRKEKLKDLIEELERVKAFEYSFASLTAQEPEFKPLENFVRKETKKLSFTTGSPVKKIASILASYVRSSQIKSGKVTGIDSDGIERVLRITDNPDNFGEYLYDDIAPRINSLDTAAFEKSWVIQELLEKCTQNKHIFEATVK